MSIAEPLTIADLLDQLGGIEPTRVRLRPTPGTATEQDVVAIRISERRLFELCDGILVEKIMGYPESIIALVLGRILGNFVDQQDLGVIAGEAGMLRLAPGLVRIPDLSFISWQRLPGEQAPVEPIPNVSPDLAVEVLSEGNTQGEMQRKLTEYFAAGVRLVWLVDPRTRTVAVHSSPDSSELLRESDTLRGEPVLPGFQLPLTDLFAKLDRQSARR